MIDMTKKACTLCSGSGKVRGMGRLFHECKGCYGVGYFDPKIEEEIKEAIDRETVTLNAKNTSKIKEKVDMPSQEGASSDTSSTSSKKRGRPSLKCKK